MSDVWKKVLVGFIAALVLFGAGFAGGYFIRQAADNKRVNQYRVTVDSLGSKIDDLRSINREITESNQELKDRLGELTDSLSVAQGRADKAGKLIEEIRAGLSGTSGNVRDIIKAIRIVIQRVKELE